MEIDIPKFSKEIYEELQHLLQWWLKHGPDPVNGGFYGEINNSNEAQLGAAKGLVLNSRILWAFSAAYAYQAKPEYLEMATRAYQYLREKFYDPEYGGFFWSLDASGDVLESKKQVYGQAFAIYGLAAYYQITKDDDVLNLAKSTYNKLEEYSLDKELGGYLEAFSRSWTPLADLRLSEKDMNAEKTMNTHLHVVEAYAELYKVWPSGTLKASIQHVLDIFAQYFISPQGYQHLFYNAGWELQSSSVSYGHDIESAWLLLACARTIEDETRIAQFEEFALLLAEGAAKGIDTDGGLKYELNLSSGVEKNEKHWWVQAEAMVGFYQAYQLEENQGGSGSVPASGSANLETNNSYLTICFNLWKFTENYLFDQKHGEWLWGIDASSQPMSEPKAGFWKCPYHHVRACLEMLERLPKSE